MARIGSSTAPSVIVPSVVGRLPGAVGARAATGSSAAVTSTALAARPAAVANPLGLAARFGANARAVALGVAAVPLGGCTEGYAGAVLVVSVLLMMGFFVQGELEAVATAIKDLRDSQAKDAANMVAAIGVQTAVLQDLVGATHEAAEAADPLFGHETRLEEVTQRLFDAYTACLGAERASTAPAEQAEIANELMLTLDTDALRAEFPQQFLAAVLLGTLCALDAGRYDRAARCLVMAEKVKDRLNAHDQTLLGFFATYIIAKNSGNSTRFVLAIESQGGALQVATFVRNMLAAVCECAGPAAGNMVKAFPAVQAMLGFLIAEAEAAREKELATWLERTLKGERPQLLMVGNGLRVVQKQWVARQAYEALREDLGASVPGFLGQIGYGVSIDDAMYAKCVAAISTSFTSLSKETDTETADRLRQQLQGVLETFILAHQSGIFAGKPNHDVHIRSIQAMADYFARIIDKDELM